MVDILNSSLSLMTTCKQFKYRLSLVKCTKRSRIIIYIQRRSYFVNAHPLCANNVNNQHPSSLIIYPHTHHTLRPQYVIASVSSASFFFSPSNFLPLQGFHGPLSEIPTNRLTHLYFLHTFCCSSIYLINGFLTCMFYLFD